MLNQLKEYFYSNSLLIGTCLILFFALFASFFSIGQSKNTLPQTTLTNFIEDTSIYILDSAYVTEGEYFPFALEDLKLGDGILLHKLEKSQIIKHRIKSIQIKGLYTEKFDNKGNKIFEQWDSWTAGSRFTYEFDNAGMPIAISILDTNGRTIGKAKYKYNEHELLLQAGELLFKYYPNGLLRSVENASEIERYQYDTSHHLVDINFDLKPGVIACGNRTTEWIGKYNAAGQLIEVQTLGFPYDFTEYLKYASDGQLIQTKTTGGFEELTTKYFYTNGLLNATKTYNRKGRMVGAQQFIYETY